MLGLTKPHQGKLIISEHFSSTYIPYSGLPWLALSRAGTITLTFRHMASIGSVRRWAAVNKAETRSSTYCLLLLMGLEQGWAMMQDLHKA
jgi:hypothetical protein